jgi:hypothetical protein
MQKFSPDSFTGATFKKNIIRYYYSTAAMLFENGLYMLEEV